MNTDIIMLFNKMPEALPIYEAAEAFILEQFPDAVMKLSKTQISFSNRFGFAILWPPNRKIKGRAGVYIVLSFGLGRRAEHPRIVESVEPYPGRWTHHVLISSADDLDDELKAWLQEAYDFALTKRRGK